MNFPELEIENFLAITSAKVELADRGLVLIQGVNHDDTSTLSNGAGKSSIPDALCWCWFGTTARGASGDEVINDIAGKGTRVMSKLVDGHLTYTATRHRKHKTGKNTFTLSVFDGLKETNLTKGTEKLTQEVANQIIGASLEVFAGSIYAGQEQMPDLPAMTDKQLKLLIEEAAGVTALEGAYKKAREDFSAAQAVLGEIDLAITTLASSLTWIEGQIASTQAESARWLTNRDAQIEQMKTQAGAIVAKIRALDIEMKSLPDAETLKTAIAGLDARIGAVSAENTRLAELEREVMAAALMEKAKRNQLNVTSLSLQSATKGLANIRHQIGCPCSSCGRPLTEAELGSTTQAQQARIDELNETIATLTREIGEAENTHKRAQAAVDTFKLSMTDISAASAERAALTAEMNTVNAKLHERETLLASATVARDQIVAKAKEASPHLSQLAKLEAERTDVAAKIALKQKVRAEQEAKVAVEAEVVKVFGPAGVRAHILDEVTPFLNAQTAQYLSTLSDGNIEAIWSTLTPNAKGELKEKFSIDVVNATGGKIFKSLSGGEKRKVRVATALALQDLVATRASKPIDLFIGDEIDDALDPAGIERLTMILEDKARERGSVFVISHNELSDYIRQTLVIEKKGGKTIITGNAA
ncbi:AAA family ATPase [Ancylobacter rudongensis]|uniref:RecF/RecN/SMC N terminal domain-containing protein n=1 Tax=Ancylobacter rudongensis TaxID=177413 RepID=A0A1G4UQ94_9HYPH|nr:AAA family ATPase [Ancylobacter rudongensis]SCW95828.1 RecF/RecN/SMC N terminal domain-containing protein [Ancylobacter rudongensis]